MIKFNRIYWILGLIALFAAHHAIAQTADTLKVGKQDIAAAENLIGIEFSDAERDSMREQLSYSLGYYDKIRAESLKNWIPSALQLNILPPGFVVDTQQAPLQFSPPRITSAPKRPNDLAYYSLRDLGELIRTRKITSTQLTKLCLDRLKKYDPKLHCVVTLTEELALRQAAAADSEIAAGHYRGPLHGIPYGAKDLLAVRGYKTTWGTNPYKDQIFTYDAAVIKKLNEAGAVLVAKLSLGELANGDVWFADTTRNPWDTKTGSSGSSAGSAAAVAAGLAPFAIGTETWGSIVSPSTVCGATGLRPTYGRVSRTGAMALSWSMDKIGPICRNVEDCAIVFDAIRGADGEDQSVVNAPFNYYPDIDFRGLKVGYLKKDFDADTTFAAFNKAALDTLRKLGVDLIEIELPKLPVEPLSIILAAEAAAAFDELTLTGRDELMTRRDQDAWPNTFRASRFIPAVEYIQANRIRTLLIWQMAKLMSQVDLYVSPSFQGDNLLLTNLTGHPCVVLPDGFDKDGKPTSITFIGKLYDEATLLAFAKKFQDATNYNRKHPPIFK